MPHTINGIGMWYHGKRNIVTQRKHCQNCGAFADLSSYETTSYIVFLFIPLIPLKKLRIIDDCPKCRRHGVAKLKIWEKQKEEAVMRASEAIAQNPGDPKAAAEALDIFAAFHDFEGFMKLAPAFEEAFADSKETLESLAAGYSAFEKPEDAERIRRRLAEVDGSPESVIGLALNLIHQFKPGEARELLESIEEKTAEHAFLFYFLGESFQAVGDHRSALGAFETCAGLDPEFGGDKEFEKARRLSEKNPDSNKKIKPRNIGWTKKEFSEGNKIRLTLAKAIAPLLLLFFAGLYIFGAYNLGANRPVYIVNGLDAPYEAIINGEEIHVSNLGPTEIEIKEGPVTVSAKGETFSLPEETIEIKTPFWSRPVSKRTFVINPDRTALLVWQEVEYAVNADPEAEPGLEVRINEPLYEFRDIDFEFAEFPDEIKMSGNRSKRRGIHLENTVPFEFLLSIVDKYLGDDGVAGLARNRLRCGADESVCLAVLGNLLPADEKVEFFRQGLKARPVKTEWHRAYQLAMAIADPDYGLEAEYREMLREDPGDPSLQYLLGRIAADPEESKSLYLQAINGEIPAPVAMNALAYLHLAWGEFDQALDYVKQALARDPENFQFLRMEMECLWATKNYAELAERYRPDDEDMADAGVNEEEIMLLALLGQEEEAKQRIEQLEKRIEEEGSFDFSSESWLNGLRGALSYVKGDAKDFVRLAIGSDYSETQLDAMLASGQLDNIDAVIEEISEYEELDAAAYLSIHLAAAVNGNEAVANKYLDVSIGALREKDIEERHLADCLEGKDQIDAEYLGKISVWPPVKRLALCALGLRNPEHKEALFAIARKLNYDPRPPHLMLKKILGE